MIRNILVDSSTKPTSSKERYGESTAAWAMWSSTTMNEPPITCGINYFKHNGPNKTFYEGIIRALEQCMEYCWNDEVIFKGDCQLVIQQLNKECKVVQLDKQYRQVIALVSKYEERQNARTGRSGAVSAQSAATVALKGGEENTMARVVGLAFSLMVAGLTAWVGWGWSQVYVNYVRGKEDYAPLFYMGDSVNRSMLSGLAALLGFTLGSLVYPYLVRVPWGFRGVGMLAHYPYWYWMAVLGRLRCWHGNSS